MDSFKLSFDIPVSSAKIVHGKNCLFLGSCFSDEIAAKAKYYGFDVSSNPFGTIFHPTAIANLLLYTELEKTIFQRDDLFFSWIAAGSIYSTNPEILKNKLVELQNNLIEFIHSSIGISKFV